MSYSQKILFIVFTVFLTLDYVLAAESEYPVKITPNLPYVTIESKNGSPIRIQRNQDTENMVDLDFAITSRACPPFCIQPMNIAPGVETIGELELLEYIKRKDRGDPSVIIIDSRTDEWLPKGMIPGAIHIPWTALNLKKAAVKDVVEILEFQLDVFKTGSLWNFENAKTAIFYCNGPWCGQSPTSIRSLLTIGYPPSRIKWYRMGMQGWKMLGLTTVTPSGRPLE